MRDIGGVIKIIRTSKGLTLKQLSQSGISTSFLSKVENNHSHLSSVELFRLTDFLNLELEELEDIYYTYIDSTERYDFLKNLQQAILTNNTYLLNKMIVEQNTLYKEKKNIRYLHNKILASEYVNRMSKLPINLNNQKILTEYLWNIPHWGIYEVRLFANALIFLNINDCKHLVQSLSQKRLFYVNRERITRSIIKIKINMIIKHLEENDVTELPLLFQELKQELDGTTFYHNKNTLNFLKGIYYIKIGENEKGKALCNRAIAIMDELDDTPSAKTHREELEKILSKQS